MSDAPVSAVIVAGGSGQRMGAAVRKQYLTLDGEPVLSWSIRPFLDHPAIDEVLVVLPPDDVADAPAWLRSLPVRLVAGGPERGDSVWNALQALASGTATVLIHDGARPFVTREIIDRVLAVAGKGAAAAAVRVSDTIKIATPEGEVVRTLDRDELWRAQTPQGFPAKEIVAIYRRAREQGVRATDDTAFFEYFDLPVRLVAGSSENFKITHPSDLVAAEAIAKQRRGGADGE